MRWFFNSPAPNLPRGRGRSRDSLPARGEGWGGGAMFKSLRIGTYQLFTPSVRFPLPAGGTAWTRGSVPLAKRGEPAGGGHFINSECAIGKCLCVGFSTCPPPNLPRGRGRSRDSLPARGEGWGGGAMFKSLRIGTYQLFTPSLMFPLRAGGTEPVRGSPREAGGPCRRGDNT